MENNFENPINYTINNHQYNWIFFSKLIISGQTTFNYYTTTIEDWKSDKYNKPYRFAQRVIESNDLMGSSKQEVVEYLGSDFIEINDSTIQYNIDRMYFRFQVNFRKDKVSRIFIYNVD